MERPYCEERESQYKRCSTILRRANLWTIFSKGFRLFAANLPFQFWRSVKCFAWRVPDSNPARWGCVDQRLRLLLTGHECQCAGYAKQAGLKTGALLNAAEAVGFEVLITTDQEIPLQQRFGGQA